MPRKRKPVLGVDYVICEDGRAQFTREYLMQRGSCCEHDCRFCPYECASQKSSESDSGVMYQCTVKQAGRLEMSLCGG